MNTIEDYKKGVKAKFEVEKIGKFAEFLLTSSPAKLKRLSVLIYEANGDKTDEVIFSKFFNFNNADDKIRHINKFDTDKFRPIQNFLLRNTDISQLESLDLIAVLVDFKPRPFLKFRSTELAVGESRGELTVNNEIKQGAVSINYSEGLTSLKKSPIGLKVVFSLIGLLLLFSVGYSFKTICFPKKEGMIWITDHYEEVEFKKLSRTNDVLPLDEELIANFRKVMVCDTTTFFINGNEDKPLIWYGKNPETRKYEYFNQPGTHPLSGKTLKKITPYIIKKYVSN